MSDSVYKHVDLSPQQYYDLLRQVAVEIPDTISPTDHLAYKKQWGFYLFYFVPEPTSQNNIKEVESDRDSNTLYQTFYQIALTVYRKLYTGCWADRCWTRQYLEHLATVDATTRIAKWSALKRQLEESVVFANQNHVEELLYYTDCDPMQIGRVEQILDATVPTNQHYKTNRYGLPKNGLPRNGSPKKSSIKRSSAHQHKLRYKKAVKDHQHNV